MPRRLHTGEELEPPASAGDGHSSSYHVHSGGEPYRVLPTPGQTGAHRTVERPRRTRSGLHLAERVWLLGAGQDRAAPSSSASMARTIPVGREKMELPHRKSPDGPGYREVEVGALPLM